MAVVKAPALSLDASGNLGGICYTRWRGLHVARDVWTGTDPNTAKQQAQRARLDTVSKAWSGTCSAEQRLSWGAVAKGLVRKGRLATEYVPTGYQYFVEVNMLRQHLGAGILLLPAKYGTPNMFRDIELSYNVPLFQVEIDIQNSVHPFDPEYYVDVFRAGPYDNGGRHAIAGEYRFLKHWQFLIDGDDNSVVGNKFYWFKVRWLWVYGLKGNFFERQILTT